MVVVAYLAGLISTPAAFLGVFGGTWWWRRLRRAQRPSGEVLLEVVETMAPPSSSPQEAPVLNRMSMRSVPGKRRRVRGHGQR